MLTLLVQIYGPEKSFQFGERIATQNALVVYHPDLFYNLDEQICKGFAEGLARQNWLVDVATVKAAKKMEVEYDLYVFCANTYNWAPDWAISNFIKSHPNLEAKPAVAITLGSGSTGRAKRLLESQIKAKKAKLIDSQTYWLMRPNDETRMGESNVNVAIDMARKSTTRLNM